MDDLIGAQCVLCFRINTPRSNIASERCVLPFPIYCLIKNASTARPAQTVGSFQVTMCSSCYRKLHMWIIFTRKAYPVVDRASTQVMFEQLSVEFQMDSYRTTATAAATPEAVRLKRAASRYAPESCMECGAPPKSSPFASKLCEAILPDILRNPGVDSTLAALPVELRSCIAEAAYRVRPHEARMFPLVVSSDPVHIEMVDVMMCPNCYHQAITRSLFPLGG